jgi:hypothetical protein
VDGEIEREREREREREKERERERERMCGWLGLFALVCISMDKNRADAFKGVIVKPGIRQHI